MWLSWFKITFTIYVVKILNHNTVSIPKKNCERRLYSFHNQNRQQSQLDWYDEECVVYVYI